MRQRDRETERQIDRETERQRDRETAQKNLLNCFRCLRPQSFTTNRERERDFNEKFKNEY